jgi:hypothetical protein
MSPNEQKYTLRQVLLRVGPRSEQIARGRPTVIESELQTRSPRNLARQTRS